MAIEQLLTALIAALNDNTQALKQTAKPTKQIDQTTAEISLSPLTPYGEAQAEEAKVAGLVQPPKDAPVKAVKPVKKEAVKLDYTKDVRPKVLGYVEAKGRKAVDTVLAKYGVKIASQVPAEKWGEMLEGMEALADLAPAEEEAA